jgi:sporulation related protein
MIETILPKRGSSNGAAFASPQFAAAATRAVEVADGREFENLSNAPEIATQDFMPQDTMPEDEDYEMVSLEPALNGKRDFLEEPEDSFAPQTAAVETRPRETPPKEPQAVATPEAIETAPMVNAPMANAPTANTAREEIAQALRRAHEQAEASEKTEASNLSPAESAISLNAVGAALAEALRRDRAAAGIEELKPVVEDIEEVKAIVDEKAVDPWDDPLPAWEYSRNEWPIALVDEKPSALQRLKLPIAIALAAAVLAAAYFLLLSPRAETPQEPIAVATPELNEPAAAPNAAPASSVPAQGSTDQSSAEQSSTDQSAPASSSTDQTASTPAASDKQATDKQATAAGEGDDVKWRHSLQAMSSQNADEARLFVERLARAGVPAYVVSANLGSRGTWHRVRIGRFTSADEALRFAAEARARAKAAGVNLKELNLCDYEKP